MRLGSRDDRIKRTSEVSLATIQHRVGQWARNLVANEYAIRTGLGVNQLFNKLTGVPCILIGAGPSLDKNISLLKDCYDKACLIVCDAALKPLLDKDIRPHICFVTDSKPIVREHFNDCYEKSEDIILVADSFVHPSVLEPWRGRIYWYNIVRIEACPLTYATIEFTGQIGQLGSGGNVTSIMWCLAYGGLKCSPIILVGHDFAFYDKGLDHASGSPAAPFTDSYSPIEVEDIYGEKCYTNGALLGFCDWYEDTFLRTPGIFINATEGGILSSGCSCLSFADASRIYLSNKFDIMKLLSGPVGEEASAENRWLLFNKDGSKTPIASHVTYFPGPVIDAILDNVLLEDLEAAVLRKRKENAANSSDSSSSDR